MRYLNIILLACGLLACSEDFGTRAFYDCRNDQDCAAGNYCEFIEISQEAQDALWNGGNAPEGVGICLRRGRDAGIVNQCDPNEGDWPRACPPGCQEAELNCIEGRLSDCGCPVPVEDAMVDDQGVDGADGGLDPDMRPLQECVPGDFYWDDQCPEDHQPEDEDLTGLCQPCGEYDGWIMRRCNDDGLGYTRLCVECMPEERVVHGQCADGTVQHRTCNDDRSWDNPTPPCDDNCREDGQSLPEDCNGIDDDCDGMTDEGHDGGATLERACFAGPHQNFAGIGQCVMGLQICGPDGEWLECSGYVEPTEEVCDGLDNDCNRITDDGLDGQPCYSGPDGTAGVGLCRIGSTNCNGNELTCRNETTPAPEICDGRDNDCDGESDEGVPGGCECGEEGEDQPCYPGPEGTEGVGACRAGIQLCIRINGGLRWGSCNNAVLPSFELCDFQDNDCDGVVNNGYNPGAPCDNGRNGVCFREGVLACTPNGNQGCELQGDPVVPSPEECDHRDNDCDGDIDEGVLNACQMCGEPPAELCNDFEDDCEVKIDAEEVCNGRDDDCDDEIDETFEDLGDECFAGVGDCRQAGVMVCDGARGGTRCNAEPRLPQAEVCDEIDNDCDGQVDEGEEINCACERTNGGVEICDGIDNDCDRQIDEAPTDEELGNQCFNGVGQCEAQGTMVCADGELRCNAQLGQPADEICNALDDDCDGTVDEGVANACGECGPDPVELCNDRDDDCDGEIDEGVQNACGGCGDVPNEVCDGADNDCDGEIDEGVQNACGGCGDLPPDICDGVDSDCDGTTDEDAPLEPQGPPNCIVGTGICQRSGHELCANGELTCNATPGEPQDEVCGNDRDDDCDGDIDEADCDAGCIETNGGVEICDGLDNDCDGDTDEAAVDVGVECRNEQCTAQGTSACVDGVLTCDVTHAVLLDGSLVACQAQDSCGGDGRGDRVDNDCDGRVDESCNCAGAPRQTNCWTRDNNGQCVRGDVTQRTCNGNQWGVCEYTGP